MAEYTKFGNFIRERRAKVDLGLREAARQIGISSSYLSRLEAGDFKPPSGRVLLRLAEVYRTDIQTFLKKVEGNKRAHEVMAAHTDVAPVVQAFYRLAYDQTPEMQEKMLQAAIGALDLPDDQKQKLLAQLKAMLSRMQDKDLPRRSADRDALFALDIKPRYLSKAQIRDLAHHVLATIFGDEIPTPVPVEEIIENIDKDIRLIVHDEIEGGRLRDGTPAVLGLSRWSKDGDLRELVIHADLFEAETEAGRRRANFTMAHELFHCLEHLPLVQQRHLAGALPRSVAYVSLAPTLLRSRWFERKTQPQKLSSRESWREWQANQFAAELLMPFEKVTAAFKEIFGVSQLVAQESSVAEFADEMARATVTDEFEQVTSLVDRFDVNPQAMAIRLMALELVVEDS